MDEIDETELLGALHSGRAVDGDLDGAKRAVSAAVLRSCCYEFRDQVDPRGLRLTNTVIAGELDLAGLTVPFPLRFHGCEFDSAPVLEGAELFELSLTSCPRLAAKGFPAARIHQRSRADPNRAAPTCPPSRLVQCDLAPAHARCGLRDHRLRLQACARPLGTIRSAHTGGRYARTTPCPRRLYGPRMPMGRSTQQPAP